MPLNNTATSALGFQRVASLATATALMPPPGAARAIIQCETQNVRYRDDNVNPTATVGMLLKTADLPLVLEGSLGLVKFIEVAPGAILNISYYS